MNDIVLGALIGASASVASMGIAKLIDLLIIKAKHKNEMKRICLERKFKVAEEAMAYWYAHNRFYSKWANAFQKVFADGGRTNKDDFDSMSTLLLKEYKEINELAINEANVMIYFEVYEEPKIKKTKIMPNIVNIFDSLSKALEEDNKEEIKKQYEAFSTLFQAEANKAKKAMQEMNLDIKKCIED